MAGGEAAHPHAETRRTAACAAVALFLAAASQGAWAPGTYFRVETRGGRPCLVAPDGRPFKSVGVVWAYGPERGAGELTVERVLEELARIQALGFNTLNLYGDRFLPEMLAWCDEHELAVFFRTTYYYLPDFPAELAQYPDYMDPEFRRRAKESYRGFLDQVRGHPSVLAIDMDHRWLFPLDWGGAWRLDTPMLRPHALKHLPAWLAERYGNVAKLNARCGTSYRSFEDVLRDPRLVQDGAVVSLTNHPLRVDLVQYTLWTEEDFLRELAAFIHQEVPFLVTPTTEHPECIPSCNPPVVSGIAFMSPVHYNSEADFGRDLAGLAKLIYESRWHYDFQGGPTYISETGWRTQTLEQRPPCRTYAWIEPPDEERAARAYALEFALLNVLPWVSGYGYFMLYDKWAEGDFGYLRDDRSLKPQAWVGQAINRAFDATDLPDPEPRVWIYYPDYALASYQPGYQQLKTWVAVWERPFLEALEKRVDEHWQGLRAGDAAVGRAFARAVTADFQKLWRGFAFVRQLPPDDKPVVLLSTVSSLLSAADRAALMRRKTLTFGPVGVFDDCMRVTPPWYLEALGQSSAEAAAQFLLLSPDGTQRVLARSAGRRKLIGTPPWDRVSARDLWPPVSCVGQEICWQPVRCTRLELLADSEEGSAAPDLVLTYEDGSSVGIPLAPSVGDRRFPPPLLEGCRRDQDTWVSRLVVPTDPERRLGGLRLPDAPWVRCHGIVLVSGGEVRAAPVTLMEENETCRVRTPWRLMWPEGRAQDLAVLARSAVGDPLVVARGRHVAFLFDPLTWAGRPDEASRLVGYHEKLVEAALEYLESAPDEQ